jgi:hypothetical protein
MAGVIAIDITAGPDAGRRIELAPGRHLIGRAPACAVAIADPAMEPFHLLIEVDERGGTRPTQLAGRTPIELDGGTVIEVGHSRLDLAGARAMSDRVSLGVGSARLPLPFDDEVWQPGFSVLVDPEWLMRTRVAVIDHDPALRSARAVARSIAAQLEAAPDLLLANPDDPSIDTCAARLEIGPRWRGRWTPDVSHPERSVRLHVRGQNVHKVSDTL